MDGGRKEDRWTFGKIQETTKRTGSHNGRLRSHFTQRRIRRWATIVEKKKGNRENEREKEREKTGILYRIKIEGTKDHGLLCRRS